MEQGWTGFHRFDRELGGLVTEAQPAAENRLKLARPPSPPPSLSTWHLPTTMGVTTHVLICMLCVTWVFPMMTSSTCDDESLHYQKDTLRKFVFLFQQLRGNLATIKNNVQNTIDTLNGNITDTNAELNARLKEAVDMKKTPMERAINVTSYAKANIAPVLNVWVDSFGYLDINAPLLTEVKTMHGIRFDSTTGAATVPIKGLYLVEYVLTTYSYYAFKSDLSIYRPDGSMSHYQTDSWIYSCPISMRMFDLEAGSVVKVSNMKKFYDYYWYPVYPYYVVSGVQSQMTIRYFGPGAASD